jgi:23S rRNA (cytosine1962-C5)-methyltransferase
MNESSILLSEEVLKEYPDVSPFAHRLLKNVKHLKKWAAKLPTEAWRAYDKDVPQFPFAVDIYADYAHVQEFETGWKMTPKDYALWLEAVLLAVSEVLGIPRSQVIHKVRRRQKGESQYEKLAEAPRHDLCVNEQGLQFWVNLAQYLDTGLFLDHRPLRAYVRSVACGQRFLNLFAYTGSFTVYAAAGGAVSSETVDLSNTYQQWTQRNLQLNQDMIPTDLQVHRCVRADVFVYLAEAFKQNKQFDLIVMDPPSFSNSKKMQGILDVQQDHVALIEGAMRLLHVDGRLFFSTNLRSFVLDDAMLNRRFSITPWHHKTVPQDFRDTKIHQSWEIKHRPSDLIKSALQS